MSSRYFCYYYYFYHHYHYVIIITAIVLYNKVYWQGLGVAAKLWLLDFYLLSTKQDPVEAPRNHSRAPGFYLIALLIFIIYLFVFSINFLNP